MIISHITHSTHSTANALCASLLSPLFPFALAFQQSNTTFTENHVHIAYTSKWYLIWDMCSFTITSLYFSHRGHSGEHPFFVAPTLSFMIREQMKNAWLHCKKGDSLYIFYRSLLLCLSNINSNGKFVIQAIIFATCFYAQMIEWCIARQSFKSSKIQNTNTNIPNDLNCLTFELHLYIMHRNEFNLFLKWIAQPQRCTIYSR